eukprot:COSAG02_NODE_5869_length_3975_cov_3.351393_5_plen_195_part_00
MAPSIVQGLIQHQESKGLQRAALKAFAPLLGANALERASEARKCFDGIDTSKDGYISLDEFVVGLRKLAPAQFKAVGAGGKSTGMRGDIDPEILRLFSRIGSGSASDGQIDLEQWLVAAVVQQEFSRRHNCAKVFALLDTNGDGRIDARELADMMTRQRQIGEVDEESLVALREWPREGITLNEFTDLLGGNER